mmetsp:Transcript_16400/g.19665  ORF Transcript_16400/g.19665 Transcript_16400/m.19665 type:complete len:349 (+) Transcript_16400:314-1360(+)
MLGSCLGLSRRNEARQRLHLHRLSLRSNPKQEADGHVHNLPHLLVPSVHATIPLPLNRLEGQRRRRPNQPSRQLPRNEQWQLLQKKRKQPRLLLQKKQRLQRLLQKKKAEAAAKKEAEAAAKKKAEAAVKRAEAAAKKKAEAAEAAAKKEAERAAKKREKERQSDYLASPAKQQVDAAASQAKDLGSGPPNSILFACVKDGKKPYPRVRVVGFFNSRGVLRVGAYDSSLNVQFPRAIRQEGKLLIAPQDCLKLGGGANAPFYVVQAHSVQEYFENPFGSSAADIAQLEATTVFEMSECVICLGERPSVMILPCGHLCMCQGCNNRLKTSNDKRCPLCRQNIQNTFIKP